MSVYEEGLNQVLSILTRLDQSLDNDEHANLKQKLANFTYLLQSPLFVRLVKIQDSLADLARISAVRPLTSSDFDIDVKTGELLLNPSDNIHSTTNGGADVESVSPRSPDRNGDAEFFSAIERAAQGREVEVVTLNRPENGSLGFGVVGLHDANHEYGIFVREIQPSSLAAKSGRLRENDQILAIDRQVLDGSVSHHQAIAALQHHQPTVELTVARGSVPSPTGLRKAEAAVASSAVAPGSPASPPPSLAVAAAASAVVGRTHSSRSNTSDMVLNSEWIQLEVIDLFNDGTGLGFGIIGGKSTGVVIKTILPGGVSYRDGRLKSGDHILQIGDIGVRGMTSEQVALVLRQCGVHVHLIVTRAVDDAAQLSQPFAPVVRMSDIDVELERLNKLLAEQREYPEVGLESRAEKGEAVEIKRSVSGLVHSLAPDPVVEPDPDAFEIELTKDSHGLGITISGYTDPSDGRPNIFISGITEGSVAAKCGRLHTGQQIVAVDNKLLDGFTSQEALELLRRTGQVVRLKIAGTTNFDQKNILAAQPTSQNVVSVTSKPLDSVHYWQNSCGRDYEIVLAELMKFKDGGGLGISLEGTVDLESNEEKNPRHFIGTILPDGPVGQNGQLKTGDELLQANDTRLAGLSHIEVVRILKELPLQVTLICARRRAPPKAASQQTNGVAAAIVSSPERLTKAKSEQTLFSQEPYSPEEPSLNQKSRSLEPLGVGGLALWSSDPMKIELQKEDKGLGFSILDYQDPLDPNISMIIIRSLVPGGVAQVDGRLVPGDRLISVNEISLANATLDQAVQALKGAPRGTVRIGILKPLSVPDQDEPSSKDTSIDEPEVAAENMYSSLMMTPLVIPSSAGPRTPSPPAYRASPSSAQTFAPRLASRVSSSQENLPVAGIDAESVTSGDSESTTVNRLSRLHHRPTSSDLSPTPSPMSSPSPHSAAAFVPFSVKSDVHSVTTHSDSSQPQSIKISLSSGQLGLRLESDGSKGCSIRSIEPGSVISKDGRLQVGDYVLAINDESLENMSNAQARSLLRRTSLLAKDFSLTFVRERPSTQKMSMGTDDVFHASSSHPDEQLHSSSYSMENNSKGESSFILQLPSPLSLPHLTTAPPPIPVSPVPDSSESSDSQGAVRLNSSSPGQNTWGPERSVELKRNPGDSLGISIIAGRVEVPNDSDIALRHAVSGIFIKHVLPLSPAAKTGKLSKGDRILEVDGVDLRDVSHEFAIEVIRKAKTPVNFLVQSCVSPAPVGSIHARTESDDMSKKFLEKPLVEKLSDGRVSPVQNLASLEELRKKYAELKGELQVVELEKDSSGLGISLAGNRSLSTMSVFVVGIHPDSVAGRSGLILTGDELLEINEHVLYGRSHLNASAVIKSITTPHVRLVMLRREDFQQDVAVHPVPSPRSSLSPQDLSSTLIRTSHNALERKESSKDDSFPSDNEINSSNEITFDPKVFSDIRRIRLEKGGQGFGFAIEERNSSDNSIGIFVKSVTPDGVAEKEGTLSVGDQVLMVNDKSFLGCTYEQALEILRLISRGSSVELVLNKQLKSPEPLGFIEPLVINNIVETKKNVVENNIALPGKDSPDLSQDSPPKLQVVPPGEEDLSRCPIIPGKQTTIEIAKEKSGLGLSIVGGSDTLLRSVIVHEVYEDGSAAKDGRLWAGDQIIAVDDEDLANVTHERAIQILRQTSSVVRMIVFRDGSPLKDEELYDTLAVEMIKKPGRGLGFSIVGKQNDSGVFIADFVKGGVAEADGRLVSGDQILSINGVDVSDATQEEVAEMLKVAMGTIKLCVSRLKVRSSVDGSQDLDQGMKKSTSNLSNSRLSKIGTISDETLSMDTTIVKLNSRECNSMKLTVERDMSTQFEGTPLIITNIEENGSVEQKLQVGDRILKINGRLTDLLTPDEAINLIKKSSNMVVLEIFRDSKKMHVPTLVNRQSEVTVVSKEDGNTSSEDETGDKGEARTIRLQRGDQGFGFSIVGGFGSEQGNLPIYIKTVFDTGPAAKEGQLKRGDQLIAVNGISLEGFTHEQAVDVLKRAPGSVVLTVVD